MHMIIAAHMLCRICDMYSNYQGLVEVGKDLGALLLQTPAPRGNQKFPLGFLTGFAADKII